VTRPDWEPNRLKFLVKTNVAVLPEDTDPDTFFTYVDIGNVTQGSMDIEGAGVRFADAPSRARRLAHAGDSVVSTVRTYLRAVATVPESERDLVFSTGFAVLQPTSRVKSRWLAYYLQGDEFVNRVVAHSEGVSYPAISASRLISLNLCLPPLAEQRAITVYLDRETAQIDALIGQQAQLIDTLRERRGVERTALAVRGADVAAPLDPSPLFWAPEIPAHWAIVPLTAVARLESGHTPSRTQEDLWQDCHIPWVSLNDVGSMTSVELIRRTVNQISDTGIRSSSARLLPAGTVVLSRDATVGRSAIMAVPMATSQHFADWVCGPNLDPHYLWLLFTSAMQPYFNSLTNGSTLRTIGMGPLRAFKIPLPPLVEQHAIVKRAREQTAKIDILIGKAERFIKLAMERRAALITAAVTGQLDVRTAGAAATAREGA